MKKIPFTKAQGAGNDFLFTFTTDAPAGDYAGFAREICARSTGVGADGWYLLDPDAGEADASLKLWNSDGSTAELSGNGTRCAAAVLVAAGKASSPVRIMTGAGLRTLQLIEHTGPGFLFDMEMGVPTHRDEEIRCMLPLEGGNREVTILNVGNPQCVVFVDEFPEDWLETARQIEGHRRFPARTNVAFVRVTDPHRVEARFFERGAGQTQSSGTGSVGAAASAILRGLCASPVTVQTPAGPLEVRWEDTIWLQGPAEIIAAGEFYWRGLHDGIDGG